MRVLVTGCSGFLGRSTVPILQENLGQNYSVVECWSRNKHGDLLSSDNRLIALHRVQPDVVLHLAWLKTGTPNYEHQPDNQRWAEATVQFADQVTGMGSRFIGLGSMIEDESHHSTPYVEAKRHAGASVLNGADRLRAWIKPSWIFDFKQLRPRVLQAFVHARLTNSVFHLKQPEVSRDFIHIQDVATALHLAVSHSVMGRWNLVTGYQINIETFIEAYECWRQGVPLDRPVLEESSTKPEQPETDSVMANQWIPIESARLLGHPGIPSKATRFN